MHSAGFNFVSSYFSVKMRIKELPSMSLKELNEKLHGRDVHLDRMKQHTPFDPGQGASSSDIPEQSHETEFWRDPIAKSASPVEELMFSDISARKRRRNTALVLGGIALVMLIGGLVFKARTALFSEERVEISITGPKNVASAEETTFTVTYANNNWAGLENVMLLVSYPESFHPEGDKALLIKGSLLEIPLGEMKANTENKVSITGKFYGSKGDLASLEAKLHYTSKGISTVFEKSMRFGVNVASSPLTLEITAPVEAVPGQDVEYVIDYNNVSDLSFTNLRVKLEYPDGFQFVSAEPRPSEGEAIWYIGNLNAQAQGKIIVRGVIAGQRDEYKRVRGMIGFFQGDGKFVAYAENERQMRIVASPFALSQTVNGLTDITVSPGENLQYVIRYKNESNVGMRDAIVSVEINPTLLDMSQLTLKRGAYDAARKMITWKASDIPSLGRIEPGASGEISFSVPVLQKIPAGSEKNLSIRSVAKIDSPDIQTSIGSNKIIGSNMLLVKLASLANMEVRAFYADTLLPNSGPVPPKVGQETSYTLRINLTNSSNDLSSARVSVMLPTNVQYKGRFAPGEEVVTFNERSNELVWEVGTVSPATNASRQLAFQVTMVPSPGDVGTVLMLMNSATFTAEDTYTHQNIRIEVKDKNSDLTDDAAYQTIGGVVQSAE